MHVIFHVSINNAIVEVDSKESFKIGLENQLSDSLEYHGCIFCAGIVSNLISLGTSDTTIYWNYYSMTLSMNSNLVFGPVMDDTHVMEP